MHRLLAVLIVTVLGGGGPPGFPPKRLVDGTSKVSRNGVVVASTNTGRLSVHLRAGTYLVSAALLPPDVTPEEKCEERSVRLKRGHTTRINLYCSIR
jgi:hypothetical protein